MRIYGLIGYPLSHSFSREYLTEKFEAGRIDAEYRIFELEDIAGIRDLLQIPGIKGFNVTIPHKEAVMPFLDSIEPEAHAVGAVNMIVVGEDGRTTGMNTDVHGFRKSLEGWLPDEVTGALVLGSGGAAKAVCHALTSLGIAWRVVSRTPDDSQYGYPDLNEEVMRDHRLIVNTTPLGMSPNTGESPRIPYDHLNDEHWVFDLIYNPAKTLFLERAEQRGAHVKNGYEMLCLQADRNWEIWSKYL